MLPPTTQALTFAFHAALLQADVNRFAEEGLRTLLIARGSMTASFYDQWRRRLAVAELLVRGRDAAIANAVSPSFALSCLCSD